MHVVDFDKQKKNWVYFALPRNFPSRPIKLVLQFLIRSVICGLTAFTTKHHIVRAGLETVCYQITDVIEAMRKDAGIHLRKLHVDGKMARNNLLMQLQADISGIPICEFVLFFPFFSLSVMRNES